MNDIHGSHGSSSVVENPFLLQVHISTGDLLIQLGDNEVDHGTSIVAMGSDGTLGQVVELGGCEDVEGLQVRVQEEIDGREDGEDDGPPGQGFGLRHGGRNKGRQFKGKTEYQGQEW